MRQHWDERAPERARAILERMGERQRRAAAARIATLIEVLAGGSSTGTAGSGGSDDPTTQIGRLEDLLAPAVPGHLWLARAVLTGRLPTSEQTESMARTARLRGPWAALLSALRVLERTDEPAPVRVAVGTVTCDIHDTSRTDFVSGIQRVVRAVSVRWAEREGVEFVGWTPDLRAMRPLSPVNHARIFGGEVVREDHAPPPEVVVPWAGTHLVPELAGDPNRITRIMALASYAECRVGIIGYDCIPLTTASSVAPGMTGMFARYLASSRNVDRIAAISDAAATEYLGWRGMLAGVREEGPLVKGITLPVAGQTPNEESLAEARRRLGVTSVPMVLVVGSHEPRKNHLAVLHAAELLWREGLRFSLTLVGAASWKAEAFYEAIGDLQGAGRPVQSIRGLPDDQLWAALQLAHCTLFPSLNEGFGLPVAESLAAGTPVITSDFGSTRDIVAPDGVPLGGILIDPRDDQAIVDALRTMLADRETYDRLQAEVSKHDLGSWDDYAAQVWDFLVEDGGRGVRHAR
ncbi:glycosyltransferase [Nocardioides sp. L-11A]|uniref:glycosyltransferase n=1 Tax=Nocardioides sp. L-11A TaxID=3043848 RepID=UPI002499E5FF|nr:glycosyltransferase [Nocardioides sp. L-11A]